MSTQPFSLQLSAFSATLARNGIDVSQIDMNILNQAAAAAAAAVNSRPSHIPPSPLPPPVTSAPPPAASKKPQRKHASEQKNKGPPSSSRAQLEAPPAIKPKSELGLRGQPWDPRLKSSSTAAPMQRRRAFPIRLVPARSLLLPLELRPPAVRAKDSEGDGRQVIDWVVPSSSFTPPLAPLSPTSHAIYCNGPHVPFHLLDEHKQWSQTIEEWDAYDQWHMEEEKAGRAATKSPAQQKPRKTRTKKKEGQVVETEAQKIKKEPLGPRKWEMLLKRARDAVGKVEAEEHAIRCFEAEGWRGAGRERVRLTADLQRAREASERAKAVIRDCIKETEDTTGFRTLPKEAYDAQGEVEEDYIKCGLCDHEESYDENDIIICDGGCERCFHEKCAEKAFNLPPCSINAVNFKEEDIYLCPACDCKADILDMINDCFSTNYEVDQVKWNQVLVGVDTYEGGLTSPKARKAAAAAAARGQGSGDGLDEDSDPLGLEVNAEDDDEEEENGDEGVEGGAKRTRRSKRIRRPPTASSAPPRSGGGGGTLMDVDLPSEDPEDEDFDEGEDDEDGSNLSGEDDGDDDEEDEDEDEEEGEEGEEDEEGDLSGRKKRARDKKIDLSEEDEDENEDEDEDEEEDLIMYHKRKRAQVDYLALSKAMFGSTELDEDEDEEGEEWEGED